MGHGARWEAIGAELDTIVEDYIAPLCENAQLLADVPVEGDWATGSAVEQVAALSYPDAPMRLLAVVASLGHGEGQRELISAFPWCSEGFAHPVRILETMPGETPTEGIVRAELGPSYVEFFDPLWFINRDLYEPGTELEVSLSALAYGIVPIDPDSHILVDDPEQIRGLRPAEETVGKADSELEPVKIHYAGARACFPRGDADAEFMSLVDEARDLSMLGIDFQMLTIGLFVDTSVAEDLVFRIPLYVATAARPEGYVAQPEDAIQGVFWLQGSAVRP
jgi:hypothetical protein